MKIHPTAIIEDGARLGDDVEIGPYCVVGSGARIGDRVKMAAHVVVTGETEIGEETQISPFAALGGAPQHVSYAGEETRLVIGARCVIREHVTMNLGTVDGGGVTRVGADGMFMTGAHVAHDCVVGDHVIMANNATLGGFVTVGDNAILGGLCAVHQFCRVGAFAFVGGCAAAPTDLIPYGSATGNHASLSGLNIIGMKRRGMDRETIHAIRRAYKTLFFGEDAFQERVVRAEAEFGAVGEVMRIIAF
ncbi:MAG: acyl-ACP--UDP-N-acetylglucosamine O-acyltransferase, partial [Pseudomonadota bacterium]